MLERFQRQFLFPFFEEENKLEGLVCSRIFLEDNRYLTVIWEDNYNAYKVLITDKDNRICYNLDWFMPRPVHWRFNNSDKSYAVAMPPMNQTYSGLVVASYKRLEKNSDIWVLLHELGHLWIRENRKDIRPSSDEDEQLACEMACEYASKLKNLEVINAFNYPHDTFRQNKTIINYIEKMQGG